MTGSAGRARTVALGLSTWKVVPRGGAGGEGQKIALGALPWRIYVELIRVGAGGLGSSWRSWAPSCRQVVARWREDGGKMA